MITNVGNTSHVTADQSRPKVAQNTPMAKAAKDNDGDKDGSRPGEVEANESAKPTNQTVGSIINLQV